MTLLDTNLVSRFLHRDAHNKYPRECEFVEALIDGEGFAISYVTQYELRRGVEDLVLRGQGRRKLVELEKFLDRVEILGLDAYGGRGWTLAARFWAHAKAHRPSIVFTDADLLIATTAAFHERPFATSEARLAENLRRIDFPTELRVVEVSSVNSPALP